MRFFLGLLLFVGVGIAQVTNVNIVTIGTDPTGNPCSVNSVRLSTPNGNIYTCVNGFYALTAKGGGGGTSLPVATGAGQVPTSIGAGTTYTAQLPPGATFGNTIATSSNFSTSQSNCGYFIYGTAAVNVQLNALTPPCWIAIGNDATNIGATSVTLGSGVTFEGSGTSPVTSFASCTATPTQCAGQVFVLDGNGTNWRAWAGQKGANGSSATCGPFDPTCFVTTIFNSVYLQNSATGASSWACSYCNTSDYQFTTGAAGEQLASELKATSGSTLVISYPATGNTAPSSVGQGDYASGSIPLLWKMWAVAQTSHYNTGDWFIGISNSPSTLGTGYANFTGLYYKSSASEWQCIVGGTATNLQAGDSAQHYFYITNAATWAGTTPIANSINIQVDATTHASCTGTIPAGSNGYFFVAGANGSSTASGGAADTDIALSRMIGLISGLAQ